MRFFYCNHILEMIIIILIVIFLLLLAICKNKDDSNTIFDDCY